uniref:Uncharacterized protein n=1 Tax=Noctiluca scintillans TaxID=2966 RepID=A0A7S0ZXU9_NOCSC
MQRQLHQEGLSYHTIRGNLDAVAYAGLQDRSRNFASHPVYLDDVDWRVPKLVTCKDPAYNGAGDVRGLGNKEAEGQRIEGALAQEAFEQSAIALRKSQRFPPKPEIIPKPGVPFLEAHPNYRPEDDLFQTRLLVRSLDEAMTGDPLEPMPWPIIFPEDIANYRSGKKVKDDCPMA